MMDDEITSTEPVVRSSYGLRDDLLMTVEVQPPASQSIIIATGRMRDILKLLNKTEWKAYTMKVDVDLFLDEYHGLKGR